MELTLLHLYPDTMSLYGEYANLSVLRRHLEALDVTVNLITVTAEDVPDFTQADLIYMGAGTEGAQKAVLLGLTRHAQALRETLGRSVTDAQGKVWGGLGLADFTTVETDKRTPGDVIAEPVLWSAPAVGFMNKCSTTSGITTPLFSSLPMGFGNEADHGPEGYADGGIFATHLTGPVLVKNPDFTDLIIRRLFFAKGWPLPEALPVLPYEREAYAVTLRELQARLK